MQTKTKFSIKILPRRQSQCDRNTDLVCHVDQFTAVACKKQSKKELAFSNLVSAIRGQPMSYINIYRFLENPEQI